METKNYYQILEIERNAPLSEIRKAFRKKINLSHPDNNAAEDARVRFDEAVEAFDVLSNTERKKIYDDYLASRENSEIAELEMEPIEMEEWKETSKRRSEKYAGIGIEELLILEFIGGTAVVDGLLDSTGSIIESVGDALDGLSELF